MFSSENIYEIATFLLYMIPGGILIYLLVDLLKYPTQEYRKKIRWLVILVFLPVLGWIYYFFYTRQKKSL
ncbi:MAG: hypothetical protein SCALA702_10780 [Melioribacteraceae bacterium]|nr:MAG: hypothetical protein SCALA702_10780 [Melioribacteraceae bacterium]